MAPGLIFGILSSPLTEAWSAPTSDILPSHRRRKEGSSQLLEKRRGKIVLGLGTCVRGKTSALDKGEIRVKSLANSAAKKRKEKHVGVGWKGYRPPSHPPPAGALLERALWVLNGPFSSVNPIARPPGAAKLSSRESWLGVQHRSGDSCSSTPCWVGFPLRLPRRSESPCCVESPEAPDFDRGLFVTPSLFH